jgi:hypothetical protein
MADGQFDSLLLGMAQKHKGIEDLLYSILSFFERRTDYFHVMETPQDRMGFMPGAAEAMIMKQFDHFQTRYLTRAQAHLLDSNGKPSAAARGYAAPTQAAPEAGAGQPAGKAPIAASAASTPATAATPAPKAAAAPPANRVGAPGAPIPEAVAATPGDGPSAISESAQKMMKHISTWNGGVTEKYYWSQSISEVTIEVEAEKGIKSKEIKVDITATRLKVSMKQKVLLDGKLHEKVNTEDSVWTLDDGKINITLEKQRQTWWKCVLEGDEEIDTTKVESTRRIDEYDGETQGAIRKIMFDQNQKMMGNPTSDQLRTAEIMKDAWNAEGSPFRGTEFDPTMLNLSGPVGDEFFNDLEQKRVEEARQKMQEQRGEAGSGGAAGSGSTS